MDAHIAQRECVKNADDIWNILVSVYSCSKASSSFSSISCRVSGNSLPDMDDNPALTSPPTRFLRWRQSVQRFRNFRYAHFRDSMGNSRFTRTTRRHFSAEMSVGSSFCSFVTTVFEQGPLQRKRWKGLEETIQPNLISQS
jgi:hypothetical protein